MLCIKVQRLTERFKYTYQVQCNQEKFNRKMQMVQIIRATSVLWSPTVDVYQNLQVVVLLPPTAHILATDFFSLKVFGI